MLISVIVISNISFYVFFEMLGKDSNSLTKALIPPFSNIFLMLLITLAFKEKILIIVRNVKLKSTNI